MVFPYFLFLPKEVTLLCIIVFYIYRRNWLLQEYLLYSSNDGNILEVAFTEFDLWHKLREKIIDLKTIRRNIAESPR